MIGVFDSGVGGLTVLGELRERMPRADITFLADRKNAPYGTKTEAELIHLVKGDVARLRSLGAERILMACCTASTVYPRLSSDERAVCVPIITPTARRAAELSAGGRIGVLATERTVATGEFSRQIGRYAPSAEVYEIAAQELVTLAEAGECDRYASPYAIERIRSITEPIRQLNIDTLILGCTHFPLFEEIISLLYPSLRLVSCAAEGARAICGYTGKGETGRLHFLFS